MKTPPVERLSYFIAGVGLGIAVLFAPHSGAGVRMMIGERTAK
jgi:hypothetical protein